MLIDFDSPVLIGALLLWILLLIVMKLKFKKSHIYLLFFTVFYLYICNVLNYTQFPIFLNEEMEKEMGQNVWQNSNLIPFNPEQFAIATSLLNVLLTVPFGFGLPFLVKANFKIILLSGMLLGAILELLQLVIALIVGFTFKYIDVNDVLFNFSGAILGYVLFIGFMSLFKRCIDKWHIRLNPLFKYIYERR